MPLKPWYNVVFPREDLREGRPLDASEFAVHLDQVRQNRARADYQNPQRFFERTYLTQTLLELSSGVARRLAGETTETSAVYNLATQFGGGKTHALTLLYHLAEHGSNADNWPGVQRILDQAGINSIPYARTAVFVGTEFDSLTGRGGDDGTPLRRTPWGEIAFQLGGEPAFAVVAEHEERGIEPKGDVIREFLPKDYPCLILMDEIINYVSTYRSLGYHNRLYNFIQALSETARGQQNVVLVVSIPASELEYTPEDEADEQRFKKMLDRVGKPIMMSAESETAEIIRRRLFEWDERALTRDGRVILPREAIETCKVYGDWVVDHRQLVPSWFSPDHAREAFTATYPFHPTALSVFERKWQALPRFQRTRGVLRLLALWVARAYQEGYKGAHRDPLIGLGTAPLDDPAFRAALFEQLGESRLEGVVTTDIAGRREAHGLRLDDEAVDTIRKARLHRKIATTIFFESNGGQMRAEATIPELRLAVAEPDLDLGNIETALEALTSSCYYLYTDRNRYWFKSVPNLNKILADRRASISADKIEERVREEVQRIFGARSEIENVRDMFKVEIDRIYFPERSGDIPDRPVLTLAILAPDRCLKDDETKQLIDTLTRQSGSSSRVNKSALIWCAVDSDALLYDKARELLAWEEINKEKDSLRLEDWQYRQLGEDIRKTERDLREAVWRAYKNLVLLSKDNDYKIVDLGLVHSSAAHSLVDLILNRLRSDGDVEEIISPNFLVRNWPPAFQTTAWSAKSVRNIFFASPQFPRLLRPDTIKDTIARGVTNGLFAYVSIKGDDYGTFLYGEPLGAVDVDLKEDIFIIQREVADAYLAAQQVDPVLPPDPDHGDGVLPPPPPSRTDPGVITPLPPPLPPQLTAETSSLVWEGEIPSQKWMTFYNKVLARFVNRKGVRLLVQAEIAPQGGLTDQEVQEVRTALLELGLSDYLELK